MCSTKQANICFYLIALADCQILQHKKEDESLNLHVTSIESEENDSFSLASVHEALMEDLVSVLLGDLI